MSKGKFGSSVRVGAEEVVPGDVPTKAPVEKKPELSELDQEKFNSIDWTSLEAELSDIVGTSVQLTPELTDRRGDPRIEVASQDMLPEAGVFKGALQELIIKHFNSDMIKDKNKYWMTLVLDYQHIGGGHNAADLVTAVYDFNTGQWSFRRPEKFVSRF